MVEAVRIILAAHLGEVVVPNQAVEVVVPP